MSPQRFVVPARSIQGRFNSICLNTCVQVFADLSSFHSSRVPIYRARGLMERRYEYLRAIYNVVDHVYAPFMLYQLHYHRSLLAWLWMSAKDRKAI
jgi:uncharacterized membrane protein